MTIDSAEIWQRLRPYLEVEHSCIVCGATEFRPWARMEYLVAKECQQCGMISVNPHFNEQGLDIFYSTYYSNRIQLTCLAEQRKIMHMIDRDWISLFVSGGRVLDVGCSGGEFLALFPPDRWERHGVERGTDAAAHARSHFGLSVWDRSILDVEFPQAFHLVMLRGVVEHLRHPSLVLEKCCSVLEPGGFLFITATPAGDSFAFDVYREKWRLFTPLEHIHFFSVPLLTRMVERFGMRLVAQHAQYAETPYANPKKDYVRIRSDIVNLHANRHSEVRDSPPFPGSTLTAVWKKSVDCP
ncbi:MAG: class I SAM-dependent methyltransferase [Magnetococcales bacterium]|nr:class I SAM-dependent methyltransferase [Magnetococcales bacterium]